MGVGVAVRAALVPERPGRAAPVTAVAGHVGVSSLEWIAGAVVVEPGPLDPTPVGGGVAARAGGAQPGTVHVLVAARALPSGDALELDVDGLGVGGVGPGLLVALGAGHRGVPSRQRPRGLRVVEAGRGPPGGLAVTGRAVAPRELAPVLVGVAVGAGGAQAQVGAGQVHSGRGQALSLPVQTGLVAVLADETGMPPLERMAGLAVVEGLAARLAPPDQLELRALVLDVAGLAVPVLGPGVKAAPSVDPLAERPVTVQALLRGDPAARLVAAGALAAPLELHVGAAERAGRDLGERREGAEQQPGGDRRRFQIPTRHEVPHA